MDTSALKSFAPEVRRRLLEAVERKLDFVLTGDTADLRAAASQVARLRAQEQAGRAELIERIAYTWFNRLAALRFLDARGWHPFRARVLTAASPEETQPEVLRLLRSGALPQELQAHTDLARLNDLLDGRLPSADPQAEAYRQLVLAACRYYHALLPFLFERLDDETELLLPDDLLTEHSVAQGFRTEISDADCAEVELLGWLYQFYISEKKDQVMARKTAVPSEDIPAVTQLFTPHWIVRYLVENSLGRLWLRSRPGSGLRAAMPYYVDDPEGQAPADALTVERPEEIRLLDPACGSGHMLTYAFDLLFQIYEEEGYAPGDIPELVLTHNLYGLEICPRATQLAQFALLAKARERTPRAFRDPVQPQVMCLEDVVIEAEDLRAWREASGLQHLVDEEVLRQLHQFRENTQTFGSLIQPVLTEPEIVALRDAIADAPAPADLLLAETQRKVLLVLDQAEMLTQRYHVVVTNPPYMGDGQQNPLLKGFIREGYPEAKADLFACFVNRSSSAAEANGSAALITRHSWMFNTSFSRFRLQLLQQHNLRSLVHLGAGAFDSISGEVVQAVAFVTDESRAGSTAAVFYDLREGRSEGAKEQLFLGGHSRYVCEKGHFLAIPGAPLSYWLPSSAVAAFQLHPALGSKATIRAGLQTNDNERFLRLWSEVARGSVGIGMASREAAEDSGKKWFPMNKGGGFRKWYGNCEYLINWQNDGSELKEQKAFDLAAGRITANNAKCWNQDYYFRSGLSWSAVSTSLFSVRANGPGFLFDTTGQSAFPSNEDDYGKLLSHLNSAVATFLLNALSPTMHFNAGNVSDLPIPDVDATLRVPQLLAIAQADWDNFETSWDFTNLPLLRPELKAPTLEQSWLNWETYLKANIARMQELETENNRLWIEAYGLEDELTPEVPEEEITLARPDRRKDVAAFLSYAVGCMMGRYSLDKPSLVLADSGDTLEDYLAKVERPLGELSFVPDEDAVVPVLDGEWFEDDVVARTREFLKVAFGAETLEENLRFIEESLGKDLRRYFIGDFYKDHLQTYKKRPIYWMFQSPKKSFQCLVYLHRYTSDTPHHVLNRYLREYLTKVRYRLEHLEHVLASGSTPSRERTQARKETDELQRALRECEEWEREVLLPLAQQRIELDLDDGVKVNYLKLGRALAPIPGLAGKGEDG